MAQTPAVATFEVLEGRSVAGPGSLCVIIAFGSWNDGDTVVAECFFAVSGKGPRADFRLRFDRGTIAEPEAREMVRWGMMDKLQAASDEYLDEWRKSRGASMPLPPPYSFSRRDPATSRLWLREAFGRDSLDRVRRITQCTTLKDYLSGVNRLGDLLEVPFEK